MVPYRRLSGLGLIFFENRQTPIPNFFMGTFGHRIKYTKYQWSLPIIKIESSCDKLNFNDMKRCRLIQLSKNVKSLRLWSRSESSPAIVLQYDT